MKDKKMGVKGMNKLRYPEKKYLSTYELSSNFFKELGIKANDITPLRKVFILKTDEGNKILKKVDYGVDRIEFINLCIEGIRETFPNIISFNKFSSGNVFKVWDDDYYIVMDLIEGREATFTNEIELNMCAETLAKMHIASLRVIDEYNLKSRIDTSLIFKYEDALKDIKDIKRLIETFKYKNKFDNLFFDIINRCINDMEKSLELLTFSNYSEYRKSFRNLVVCHNDLAEHNFLYCNEDMYLIDFDYSSIDLRIMDLADIVLKGIKNAAFDVDKAIGVIKSYDNIYKIEKEEYKLLYIILLFPRDLYTLAKDYYHKQKSWDEEVFLNRLNNKIINDDFRREFLSEYKERFKEELCLS